MKIKSRGGTQKMNMFFYINEGGGLVQTKLKKGDIVAYRKEFSCVSFYRPDPESIGCYAHKLYIGDGIGRKDDKKIQIELNQPGALLDVAEMLSACTGMGCELLTREQFPNVDMAFKFV